MAFQLNDAENMERVTVRVNASDFPIALENKRQCLRKEGVTENQIESIIQDLCDDGIPMEMYYEVGYGFFLVESEAVESGTIYSPYSGELGDEAEVNL